MWACLIEHQHMLLMVAQVCPRVQGGVCLVVVYWFWREVLKDGL